ncbi:hypothetical protein GCM10009818_05610 [Nakamurella flavida]
MSTVRARSALLTWGAVLFAGTLLVTACTGDPVATGTVPVTSFVVSTSDVADVEPLSTAEETSEADASTDASPLSDASTPGNSSAEGSDMITVTAPTNAPTSPDANPPATLDIPPGATENTTEGAAVFIRWWLKLGSASVETRNTNTLEAYTSPSCSDCADALQRIRDIISAGQSVRASGESWSFISQIERSGSDAVDAVVYLESPPAQYINSDGSVAKDRNPFHYVSGITVQWSGQHWVLSGFKDLR